MPLIDLHIHTTESDGTDAPAQVIPLAAQMGLGIISITDHNVISAYQGLDLSRLREETSVNVISGVEFCANFGSLLIEVLGYGFDPLKMQQFIDRRFNKEWMEKKEKEIFEYIKAEIVRRGFKIDPQLAYVSPFATEAFEKELWKHPENMARFPEKLAKYPEMLFRYMNDPGSELYMFDSYFPSCEEVVAGIKDAGGLAFLAHPYTYLAEDRYALTESVIRSSGIDGLEVFYSLHSEADINGLLELSRRYRIYVSGGSDYHGRNKPHIKLGRGLGNLQVPWELTADWIKKII